jgi:hypothetical protein
MAPRTNPHVSLSSTDVLIAMLSSDLRGSWLFEPPPPRRLDPAEDPAEDQSPPHSGSCAVPGCTTAAPAGSLGSSIT